MSAVFDMPIETETLAPEELSAITGYTLPGAQARWLAEKGWSHHINRAGAPVVGRLYARLKLGGVELRALPSGGWLPDFSKV